MLLRKLLCWSFVLMLIACGGSSESDADGMQTINSAVGKCLADGGKVVVNDAGQQVCRDSTGREIPVVDSSHSAATDPDQTPVFEDLCGDGQCQEIVCEAVGCPCAETAQSCPQDCVG